MLSYGCNALAPSLSSGVGLLHRRPVIVDPLQTALTKGRVLGQSQQKQPAPQDGQPVDQEGSDTLGVNFGVGIGLADTPLIDSLLERLLRRKQLLLATAAAYSPGWGAVGGVGYYPNQPAVFPYAGPGVIGGGGVPWNRPAAYPYPALVPPSINPFGGIGGFGGFSGGAGGSGWGGAFGGFGGGFTPLFDYDDFGFRGNGNGYSNGNGFSNGNGYSNGNVNGNKNGNNIGN